MDTNTSAIKWETKPRLKNPVFIAAFEGWNDGGQAPSMSLSRMIKAFDAKKFASLDPEEFYVFTENRPNVQWADEHTRQIDWQTNDFYHARLPGAERDAILFQGTEPNLRWRGYCNNVLSVAGHYGADTLVTLGAYLADVLYTLPVQVNGFSNDPAIEEKHELERSQYEGPTGIVGVLGDTGNHAGLTTLSLWAAVPYYISIANPKAVHALLSKLQSILSFEMNLGELEKDADNFDNEINDVVAKDPNVAAYVRELKKREFLN